jgi:hypothetical protein
MIVRWLRATVSPRAVGTCVFAEAGGCGVFVCACACVCACVRACVRAPPGSTVFTLNYEQHHLKAWEAQGNLHQGPPSDGLEWGFGLQGYIAREHMDTAEVLLLVRCRRRPYRAQAHNVLSTDRPTDGPPSLSFASSVWVARKLFVISLRGWKGWVRVLCCCSEFGCCVVAVWWLPRVFIH